MNEFVLSIEVNRKGNLGNSIQFFFRTYKPGNAQTMVSVSYVC